LADALYLGIDLGTGGVRAAAVHASGRVHAEGRADLSGGALSQGDRHEQDPEQWWTATRRAIARMLDALGRSGSNDTHIVAASVDGTSGTILCVDADGQSLGPAIMYNDGRAQEQAARLAELSGEPIAPSWAIARVQWLAENDPDRYERARWILHQADYITSRLTLDFGRSDYSNALKMGYDIQSLAWPDWVQAMPGARHRLPDVVAPAEPIGQIDANVANELGLPSNLQLFAGATDGTAGFLASGAAQPGEVNATLGTTLVFKAMSDRFVEDPTGRMYCHRLPGEMWLPGAASSTGGEWISHAFAEADLAAMDRHAAAATPIDVLAWPLVRTGERFPVLKPAFAGFCDHVASEADRFAAMLQGTAFVERMCYHTMQETMGGPQGDTYATGGGSTSNVWMQIRSDVTGSVMHRPAFPEAAFGAAVLAAAGHQQIPVMAAVRQMVQIDRSFVPTAGVRARYDDLYEQFCERVKQEIEICE
jgi:D-ribulokinase